MRIKIAEVKKTTKRNFDNDLNKAFIIIGDYFRERCIELTLVVCLKGKDGIVLASDSRGTFGDPRGVTAQNDNMKKVYPVSKYVGVLLAGSGELGATVIDEIQKKIKEQNIQGVTPAMKLIREILIERFNEWFPGFQIFPVQGSTAPVRPTLVVIVGGYDLNEKGEPVFQKIYTLNCHNNFAPFLHDYGFALEGVAQYALYFLNRFYKSDLAMKELSSLAGFIIYETATQDGKVGGQVQMLQILPNEGCLTLNPEDINKLVRERYKET